MGLQQHDKRANMHFVLKAGTKVLSRGYDKHRLLPHSSRRPPLSITVIG
jgi:hypothetical protein